MKNKKVKNAIAAFSCCSVLSFSAFAQVQEDMHVRWGEEDSTSYVEIVNGKFGIVMEGKRTLEAKYDIENFQEAVNYDGNAYFSDSADFVLGLDGKWGVINNRGQIKIPFEYEYIRMERAYEDQRMQYAGVQKNGKIALMDHNGKLLTGFEYDAFYGFYKNGFMMSLSSTNVVLRKGEKILFYDPSTKKLLNANDDVFNTPESKIVWYKGKVGVISRNGEILLPVEYDNAFTQDGMVFQDRNQLLTVVKDRKEGIWQHGKGIILPIQYATARAGYVQGKMYFIVSEKEKYALLNSESKNITGYEYDQLYISDDQVRGEKGEKVYNISATGVAVPIEN
jgi:hypothetical protein